MSSSGKKDESNERIRNQAIEFAKRNKNKVAKDFTDLNKYQPDEAPIAVFMAGSPGAGKTEFSKNLINNLKLLGDLPLPEKWPRVAIYQNLHLLNNF
ncbi:MAG: zeta toxin family protein [Candidatus Paceibacterota bacterium]|jgi:pantothenate kinase-related protein Tda10